MKHAESLLPHGKQWKLVWNDEFDGNTLDRGKWDFRLNMMQRRHTALLEGGIHFEDSCIHLELVRDKDQFRSPQLQTGENFMDRRPEERLRIFNWPIAGFAKPKFLKKYGYFECRCKLQRQPGWWSAFWLQSPVIGSSPDPGRSGIEIDIMENFTRDGEFSHNIYWNGYGPDIKAGHSGPRRLETDIFGFHTYGLEWNPEGYVFYVDGRESWRFSEAVSHTEQFILITTECQTYRYNGMPDPALHKITEPDAFAVDYVRVFDEVK